MIKKYFKCLGFTILGAAVVYGGMAFAVSWPKLSLVAAVLGFPLVFVLGEHDNEKKDL